MDLVTALTAAPPAAGVQAGSGADPAAGEGDGAFAGMLEQASAPAAASGTAAAATDTQTVIAGAEPAVPPAATAAAAVAAAMEDVPLVAPEVPAQAVPELPPVPAIVIAPVAAEAEAAAEAMPPPPQPQKPAGGVHRAHRVDLTPGLQEAGEGEAAATEAALAALDEATTTETPVEAPATEVAVPDAAGDAPADPALLAAAVVPPPAPPPAATETERSAAIGAVGADKPALPQPAVDAAPVPVETAGPPTDVEMAPVPAAPAGQTAPLGVAAAATAEATAAAANPAAANAAPAAPAPKSDIAKAKLEASANSRGIGAAGEAMDGAAQPATAAADQAQAVASTLTGGDAGSEKPADDGAGLMRSEPVETQPLPGAPTQATAQSKAAAEVSAAQAKPNLAHLTASDQVAVHVARAIDTGTDSISIRLDPADLGRVDVTLDFGTDGRVSATVLAERPETLRLLQRDAQSLERAFADAGLKADSGALNFGLRRDSGGFAEQGGDGRQGRQDGFGGFGRNGGGSLADAAPIIPARTLASMRALDIRI